MKDNKGFSLIELLVSIMLVSILGSILVSSISGMFSSEASKTAKNINSQLSKCKVQAMSRAGDVCIVIYRDGNKRVVSDYYENGVKISSEEMGGNYGQLSYTDSMGNTVSLDEGGKLYISFHRGTGALKTIGAAAIAAGVTVADDAYCKTINVRTDTRNFEIELVQSTGKHSYTGGG